MGHERAVCVGRGAKMALMLQEAAVPLEWVSHVQTQPMTGHRLATARCWAPYETRRRHHPGTARSDRQFFENEWLDLDLLGGPWSRWRRLRAPLGALSVSRSCEHGSC